MTKPPEHPFASLAKLRDALPEGPKAQSGEKAPPPRPEPFGPKVVVSKSRKGRGGRTVTIVSGLRGDAATREAFCRELKKALGCGASVDGDTLVVSGDIGDRVALWLERRGAKRVIRGA